MDIELLKQDQHNFNKGTARGRKLMERSFKQFGAGRSILIDKNDNIIAGNKSQEAAIAAGIKKVRIIETDGTELVAVKRTDIELDSKEGRELALADNATARANIDWNPDEIASMTEEYGMDEWVPEESEVQITSLDISDKLQPFFQLVVVCNSESEMNTILEMFKQEGYKCSTLIL